KDGAPSLFVSLPGGLVWKHRVVEEDGVDQFRRRCREWPCLQGPVIQVVRSADSYRLCVGVRQFGLADEHLGTNRANSADLSVSARRDGARDPEPFADV